MKRIGKIVLLLLIAFIVPFSLATGQEKKSEQKIKIVVAGKEGSKTILDTTFTEGKMPHLTVSHGGTVYVTTSESDDGEKTKAEKVIIMSGDKGEWTVMPSTGTKKHVYVHASTDTDKDNNTDATKYVIAKDGVVVTVESDNEEKAREILKLIEEKLNVKTDSKKVKPSSLR